MRAKAARIINLQHAAYVDQHKPCVAAVPGNGGHSRPGVHLAEPIGDIFSVGMNKPSMSTACGPALSKLDAPKLGSKLMVIVLARPARLASGWPIEKISHVMCQQPGWRHEEKTDRERVARGEPFSDALTRP